MKDESAFGEKPSYDRVVSFRVESFYPNHHRLPSFLGNFSLYENFDKMSKRGGGSLVTILSLRLTFKIDQISRVSVDYNRSSFIVTYYMLNKIWLIFFPLTPAIPHYLEITIPLLLYQTFHGGVELHSILCKNSRYSKIIIFSRFCLYRIIIKSVKIWWISLQTSRKLKIVLILFLNISA